MPPISLLPPTSTRSLKKRRHTHIYIYIGGEMKAHFVAGVRHGSSLKQTATHLKKHHYIAPSCSLIIIRMHPLSLLHNLAPLSIITCQCHSLYSLTFKAAAESTLFLLLCSLDQGVGSKKDKPFIIINNRLLLYFGQEFIIILS
jgi:hypothetical protein